MSVLDAKVQDGSCRRWKRNKNPLRYAEIHKVLSLQTGSSDSILSGWTASKL